MDLNCNKVKKPKHLESRKYSITYNCLIDHSSATPVHLTLRYSSRIRCRAQNSRRFRKQSQRKRAQETTA